jgi:hypothetical protein
MGHLKRQLHLSNVGAEDEALPDMDTKTSCCGRAAVGLLLAATVFSCPAAVNVANGMDRPCSLTLLQSQADSWGGNYCIDLAGTIGQRTASIRVSSSVLPTRFTRLTGEFLRRKSE